MFLTKEKYETLTGTVFSGNWFIEYNRALALFQNEFLRFPYNSDGMDEWELTQIEKAFIFQISQQVANAERNGVSQMRVGNFNVVYEKGYIADIDDYNSTAFNILDDLNYRHNGVVFATGCQPWD